MSGGLAAKGQRELEVERMEKAAVDIYNECQRATEKFPPFNSGHEGYAVIYEEMDELWEEVKRYPHADKRKLREEAVQVGAMALRFIVDICE